MRVKNFSRCVFSLKVGTSAGLNGFSSVLGAANTPCETAVSSSVKSSLIWSLYLSYSIMNPCLSFDVSHLKNKTKTKKTGMAYESPGNP